MNATDIGNIYFEQALIQEMDRFIRACDTSVLIESDGKLAQWAQGIMQKFMSYAQKAKTIGADLINRFTKFVASVVSRLTPDKQAQFEKDLSLMVGRLSGVINFGMDEKHLKTAVHGALQKALDTNLLNREDLVGSFKQNKEQVVSLIKQSVAGRLEQLKQNVASEVEKLDAEVNGSPGSKTSAMIKSFASGSIFMGVFGLIDNLGLFVGMEVIEEWIIAQGFDAGTAAGFGNTFSDAAGAAIAGIVAFALAKWLNVKTEGTRAQQTVGVTIGCLIPVIIRMLFILLM